ncbi:hypothetical protein AVEN_164524-1 [Araneus ventricosus]|uniref:Uncharacterized protein n=1 Tax=Araneus ventricosus TaxID=182803 RepID=A0A4Y2B3E2_ARAVE|nr:hypothetical protein AVEN_164524-1 [Araneus ventricosus]
MFEEWQTSWKNGAIQAGKSITSCPQLVSVPLIVLGCYILLSTWPFPCLPQKVSPVSQRLLQLWWNWHGTSQYQGVYLHSVLAYEEASAKLRTRMAEKSRQ